MTVNKCKTVTLLLTCIAVCATLLPGCKKDTIRIVPGTPPNNNQQNNGVSQGPRRPPVANAGPDQTVLILNQYPSAQLDGWGSFDSSGTPLRYIWRQLTGPAILTIQTPEAIGPWVEPQISSPGDYVLELNVYNVNGSDLDTVKISFQNPGYCPTNRSEIPVSLTFLSDMPRNTSFPEIYTSGNKLIFPVWIDEQAGIVTNTIYIYDRVTGSWNTINASLPRTMVSTVVAGDKIFFAGGLHNNFATGLVDIYDLRTNSWSTDQLSEARAGISSIVHGNKIYFAGGVGDHQMRLSKRIDIYDLQSNLWTTGELPTEGRVGITAVTVLDKVLFAGGYTAFNGWNYHTPSTVIEAYSTISNSWTLDTMSVNKGEFAGIQVNNSVYFAGGILDNSATFHVESRDWNTANRNNSCLFQPMVASNNNSAVTKNDKVLFYSYLTYSLMESNKFDIYNWQTNTWSIGVLPPNLVPSDKSRVMIVSGQDVYIVIGSKLYRMNI